MGIRDTDINGPIQYGTAYSQATISKQGVRQSVANCYLDPNPSPNNLHILTKAFVTRILFTDYTASGVEYVKDGQTLTAKARREVIVSAGEKMQLR